MPVCLRLPVLKVDRSQAGLLLNQWGLIVGWACDTANVYDSVFHPIIEQFRDEMIILADTHFHLSAFCLSADRQAQAGSQEGDPDNLKICRRGEWNVRMLVETVFSMLTTVSHFKKLAHLPIACLPIGRARQVAYGSTSKLILALRWLPSIFWCNGMAYSPTEMASFPCLSLSSACEPTSTIGY